MGLDYAKLGLRCGLEIHQQLDTSKLFCNCPSLLRKDEPDFEVKRRLHAVAGESGEIDVAAAYQAAKGKEFVYQGYDTTCLVELDEEPPHLINPESLSIAIQIAILLNCKLIPITQIMRKTVVDGSNTSGFQRSVLIARDGFVETEFGRVGIESVCLEEDAARIIDREKGVFRLDRLGIPLVEIATAPDIRTPEQAKEVALYIGNILRSSRVKRGLGTIRQDVNLSIKGGKRVEMKGFQDIRNIERAIRIEVERQKNLVGRGKSAPEVRQVLPDGSTRFLRPLPGSARMYPETDLPLLKISRQMINDTKRTLPKMKKDVREELTKEGLNEEMISLLLKQNKLEEFRNLIEVLNKPKLVSKILLVYPKEIASHKKMSLEKVEKILEDNLADVLDLVKKKKISEHDIKHVLENIVEGKGLDKTKIERADLGEVEEKILKIIKEKPGLSDKAYMGLVMKEFRGKISGREAMEIIKKYIQ
jgi:Glu-tRNA(Gln) amidotransferase subunit E-like FAD-binding protein